MKTQVAIIGAGPAGLLLAHLLHRRGIESVVLEHRSQEYVESRVRAGVLEQQCVDVLNAEGVGERMMREGLLHHGIHLRFRDHSHRIDFQDLTGRGVMIYGQQEVVRDLIGARQESGEPLTFEVDAVSVHDVETDHPRVRYRAGGADHELQCDFIAGCDGFHGICRDSLPAGTLQAFERLYPFAWLGILAEAAPVSEELIYACHDNGFALLSMRSPSVSRLYLQCRPQEDLDAWTDERIWEELQTRLGSTLATGRILQKSLTPMRSFVVEPMSHGRLFLAGDAAHIVPPTGAKGMNQAIADVQVLAAALESFYAAGSVSARQQGLRGYSDTCLQRVWKVQRFSAWMTTLLHRFDGENPFDRRRQLAELEYIVSSRAAALTLAENYVGLPP